MKDSCIIGIDIAKPPSGEYSCIVFLCKNCNTVIKTELFKGEESETVIPDSCPLCKTEFTKTLVLKEEG